MPVKNSVKTPVAVVDAVKKVRKSKKNNPLNGAVIDADLVEPENVVVPEETTPNYDTEEEKEVEIIETINEVENEEENEESDDEDLKALEALQKKIKQKELKKNIILIRKRHIDFFKNDLTNKEQQLKNMLLEIETIKQSIISVENGDDDELLINAELHKATKTQSVKAVKKEGGSMRISKKIDRPTGRLTECFKRKTLIHHNKSGINEYAYICPDDGFVYACDENGIKKEGVEVFKTLNAFTNKNYADKNEREGKTRTTRNNTYETLIYKNDAGIWCSCADAIIGNVLTQ